VIAKALPPARSPNGDALISKAFNSLAAVLLRMGTSAPQAEFLMRASFVHAAAALARLQGTQATQSQIASLAGLNRVDVRKLSNLGSAGDHSTMAHRDRIGDLLYAWRHDPAFIDRRGSPRPLTTIGRDSQFAKLVKKYGRDVTTKVLRMQLIRMGLATEKMGKLTLNRRSSKQTKEAASATADLRYFEEQIRAITPQVGRRAYVTRSAAVNAPDKKTARRFQKLTIDKIHVLLAALDATAHQQSKSKGRSTGQAHRVIVTATVATESRKKGPRNGTSKF
jgi:hypothetical protein